MVINKFSLIIPYSGLLRHITLYAWKCTLKQIYSMENNFNKITVVNIYSKYMLDFSK